MRKEDKLAYSDKYRYKMTMINTLTDTPVATRYAKDVVGLKRGIVRQFKLDGGDGTYDNTGEVVIYVYDVEYTSPEGCNRLKNIEESGTYIDRDIFDERGIDFDIWHDEYLTEEQRAEFDALRVH